MIQDPIDTRDRYLQLFHDPRLPAHRLAGLIRRFQCLTALFDADREVLSATGLDGEEIAAIVEANKKDRSLGSGLEQDHLWLEHPNHTVLTFEDPRYPPLLREIPFPPPLLFVEGSVDVLNFPQIAVVGSRKASHAGCRQAGWLAQELSESGFSICSGLARGIDAAAHTGALAGRGLTVAVLGTGIDRVYPPQHRGLAQRISEHGALVSEFPLGSQPLRPHFPRRNRIISGLSIGLVVVEAGLQSGSLVTAKHALDQNRLVFAVPGPIDSALNRGCHALIKNGSVLTESPTDILEEIQSLVQFQVNHTRKVLGPGKISPTAGLNDSQRRLLQALGDRGCHLEVAMCRTGLCLTKIQTVVLELEMLGLLERDNGFLQPLGDRLASP